MRCQLWGASALPCAWLKITTNTCETPVAKRSCRLATRVHQRSRGLGFHILPARRRLKHPRRGADAQAAGGQKIARRRHRQERAPMKKGCISSPPGWVSTAGQIGSLLLEHVSAIAHPWVVPEVRGRRVERLGQISVRRGRKQLIRVAHSNRITLDIHHHPRD